jgi:hypothetical protein
MNRQMYINFSVSDLYIFYKQVMLVIIIFFILATTSTYVGWASSVTTTFFLYAKHLLVLIDVINKNILFWQFLF